MVITDRLLKSVTIEAITIMRAEACIEHFVQCYYRYYRFPNFIISNRGSNWVGDFWRRLYKLVEIKQRLSMAFYLQTDRGPERMN